MFHKTPIEFTSILQCTQGLLIKTYLCFIKALLAFSSVLQCTVTITKGEFLIKLESEFLTEPVQCKGL